MASRHRPPPLGAAVAPRPLGAQGILALDFFTADLLNDTKVYVLAVIEHGSRRVRVLDATEHPVQSWVVQQARNLLMDLGDAGAVGVHRRLSTDGHGQGVPGMLLVDALAEQWGYGSGARQHHQSEEPAM